MTREINATFNANRRFFKTRLGSEFAFTPVTGPYEYLLGALSGCFYATLADIAERNGVSWNEIQIKVQGEKRSTSPTTLEHTALCITAKGVNDKEGFKKDVEEAAATCSIYATISKVSCMEYSIAFED